MTGSPAVAVLEPGYADYATERSVLSGWNVRIAPVACDEDAASALRTLDPVAVMVRERTVTADLMDICPHLRIIVRYGVGVDNVDLEGASERQIYVANVPDYGAENEVSEHALALYLAVQRRIVSRDREVREGKWGIAQDAMIPSRENAVLGLIGCGRIGLATARKFRAIGFDRILAFDPFVSTTVAHNEGLDMVDLDTIFQECDAISLHAPLTPESRHIVNRDSFARMKPTTILVNVSRGGLVDEQALAEALQKGAILGAGIDVFESEPPPENHPLFSTPNTVLSDHTAWYSERSVGVLQSRAAAEIGRVLSGKTPENWVNPWA